MVFYRAFENGIGPAWDAVTTPPAQHAFYLTIMIALIAVPPNAVFGVAAALAAGALRVPRQAAAGRADRPPVRGLARSSSASR